MVWSDLFYPENPKRRERLIRKSQQFFHLIEDNFNATNDLIEVVNKHLKLSLGRVTLNESATVKDNCNVLIQRIREIQAEIWKIDNKLKIKLDPALYEELKNMNLYVPLSMATHTQIAKIAIGAGGMVTTAAVCWLIKSEMILASVTTQIGAIASTSIGAVVLGVVFLGVGMIVEAILGSIERDQLESALKEYDEALEEFRPASKQYQKSIMEVRLRIELIKEYV
ncbi:single-pass membrane and coiled-coil domain-containing protein 3 [Misgurnus anguillicaudatus]|uniref:single-pass membrane and coiled-coil domain-containing protein 3 n=1 Tax=Misgurnus anguillicaudatus TaxID=75329 RepID=UPI002435850C|nr:single-pass membrane and coiled-coil domain-containing protein 3-like [Misgurnus anguillicaudatus]